MNLLSVSVLLSLGCLVAHSNAVTTGQKLAWADEFGFAKLKKDLKPSKDIKPEELKEDGKCVIDIAHEPHDLSDSQLKAYAVSKDYWHFLREKAKEGKIPLAELESAEMKGIMSEWTAKDKYAGSVSRYMTDFREQLHTELREYYRAIFKLAEEKAKDSSSAMPNKKPGLFAKMLKSAQKYTITADEYAGLASRLGSEAQKVVDLFKRFKLAAQLLGAPTSPPLLTPVVVNLVPGVSADDIKAAKFDAVEVETPSDRGNSAMAKLLSDAVTKSMEKKTSK